MNDGDFDPDPIDDEQFFEELANRMDLIDGMSNDRLSDGELDRRREDIMNRVRRSRDTDRSVRQARSATDEPAVVTPGASGPAHAQPSRASLPTLEEARQEAWVIVRAATAAAAAVSWAPGSSILLSGIDSTVITLVADAFGVSEYSVEEAAAAAGTSRAGKHTAQALLKLIPSVGGAISSGYARAVTAASGAALIEYMERRSPYR